jgi:predicted TPR repeat methyltransferase
MQATTHPASTLTTSTGFQIRFPQTDALLEQDEEWCEVLLGEEWERIRFHDYDRIYAVPGLYEAIFYDRLRCSSPQRVVGLLDDVLSDQQDPPEELRVIDLGAGNGIVGETLQSIGVERQVGIDIIPEAREAAMRDRPGLYEHYLVANMCDLGEQEEARLLETEPNCLATVAALGFGDIPPLAFATAYNLIAPDGWVAFNIKDEFLNGHDGSGFSSLIRNMTDEGIMRMEAYRRYEHRLSICGEPLHYVAMVASKQAEIPATLVADE